MELSVNNEIIKASRLEFPTMPWSENISRSSLDSIPEMRDNHESYIRTALVLLNTISLLVGIYILYYKDYYLNNKFNFPDYTSLFIFIIIYTPGMLTALLLSFLISLGIKIFYKIKQEPNRDSSLVDNEIDHSSNSFTRIKKNSDDIGLIPYTLTIFIVLTIGIYVISFPYSLCLFIALLRDKNYGKFSQFFGLYFFLFINALAGILFLYVFYLMVFLKRIRSVRHPKIPVEDENVERLRSEIRGAMKNAE